MTKEIQIFINDLPDHIELKGSIAIDTEAMGLQIVHRDRLCLVQMCDENGQVVMVHYPYDCYNYNSPNLTKLLLNTQIQKIFHYARFDLAIMMKYLNIKKIPNVFCTKIASKLSRTYTDHHGLKTIVMELLGIELKKEQQSSNWGAKTLTEAQKMYAKNDVFYLHRIKNKLEEMLTANNRDILAREYFDCLHTICQADLSGFDGATILSHM